MGQQTNDKLWERIAHALGARVPIVPRSSEGDTGPPEVLDPGRPGLRFLALAAGQEESDPYLCTRAIDGRSAGKVEREIRDLQSDAAPRSGGVRLDRRVSEPPQEIVALPPLYFCKHTNAWIAVTALGADGRFEPLNAVTGATEPEHPLAILWNGVQRTAEKKPRKTAARADDAIPEPFCYTCDRRVACYPATSDPQRPGGAVEALVPVVTAPWAGALVEPFDLSLPDWLGLLDGRSAGRLRVAETQQPWVLRRIESKLEGRPRSLIPRDFMRRAAAEALLLRLELLRQMLNALRDIHLGLGHPHLGLEPKMIWIELSVAPDLSPALWSPDLQILDLAPEQEGDDFRYPEAYPPELKPAERASRTAISGMLVSRGETTEEAGHRGVKFLFLPEDDPSTLPEPAERVTVAIVRDGKDLETMTARIEVAFADVFRLVVFPTSEQAAALQETIKSGSQTVVRMGDQAAAPDPDLFAAGTIWLGMLRQEADDMAGAAALRAQLIDTLAKENIERSDHGGAERICLQEVSSGAGLFRGALPEKDTVQSASELQLLGRCLWLGLRMCLPLEEHEHAGDGRTATYGHFLREVDSLVEEARYLMLGRSSPDEEILSVVRAFEAERSGW